MRSRASVALVLAAAFGPACSSSSAAGNSPSPDASMDSGGSANASGATGNGTGGAQSSGNGGISSGAASARGGTSGASGGGTSAGGIAGASGNAGSGGSSDGGGAPPADGGSACAVPAAPEPSLVLADFENGSVPDSETGATEGFRDSDVMRATILSPGANGTAQAAEFSFATDNSIFFQGSQRTQYLSGKSTYDAFLGNALEFYVQIPSGSTLLAASGDSTFSVYTYHWKPGDPWVGTNSTGGNLTDSQEHGYGPMRFDPSGAGKWLHVIMTASAFDHSRGNYHFYAARAVALDQTFFGSLRQFQPVYLADQTEGPTSVDFDEFRLITVPDAARICPPYSAATVPAGGGDVNVPITIENPTDTPRWYRAFVSSEIGLDRQTLEVATHDADDVTAVDNLQGAVGADGSLGAAELFAADGSGKPTGPNFVASAQEIAIPAHGTYRAVLVHHVTAAMLGPVQSVMNAGHTYQVRRDTLTTSVIVWDPSAPRVSDAAAVFTGSNADSSHPAPPGFPPYVDPPTGFHSTDVPPDQAAGYFVSVLTLTP